MGKGSLQCGRVDWPVACVCFTVNSLSSVIWFSAQTCIYKTREKAPWAWRPPEGNERPGSVHVSTPGSDDSPTPRPSGRPSGGPQLLSPFALLGQFFTQRARWCPEAIGQMRCAGPRDTPGLGSPSDTLFPQRSFAGRPRVMREEGPHGHSPSAPPSPAARSRQQGPPVRRPPQAPRGFSDLSMRQTHGWAAEIQVAGPRPQNGA